MKDITEIKSEIRDKINNKEEKILLFKILDNIEKSIRNDEAICTNFLNLAQIDLIKKYIKYPYMYIDGGTQYNERNVIILSNKEIVDIAGAIKDNISYIEIKYLKYEQRTNITHRDILGTILSLGIERELIGDIYVNDDNAYIIVKSSICRLLIQNINKVKNVNVKIKKITKDEVDNYSQDGMEKRVLVSSMRIDNVLSSTLKISRNKVDELIDNKKTYINWKNEVKKDKQLKIGDIISVRGIGRIVIKESIGTSKKGKISLNIIEYR